MIPKRLYVILRTAPQEAITYDCDEGKMSRIWPLIAGYVNQTNGIFTDVNTVEFYSQSEFTYFITKLLTLD